MWSLVFQGFLLGWSVAWPPGPINTEMIRRGLSGGFWRAYVVGLGACVSDFFWALVVAAGIGTVLNEDGVRPILGGVSLALLLYLAYTFLAGAWRQWQKKKSGGPIEFDAGAHDTRKGFLLGMTMALVSPWNLAFWLAVMGSQSRVLTFGESVVLASAVVAGATTWGVVLCTAIRMGARFTTPTWELVTRALTGLLMLVFAGLLAVRLVY